MGLFFCLARPHKVIDALPKAMLDVPHSSGFSLRYSTQETNDRSKLEIGKQANACWYSKAPAAAVVSGVGCLAYEA